MPGFETNKGHWLLYGLCLQACCTVELISSMGRFAEWNWLGGSVFLSTGEVWKGRSKAKEKRIGKAINEWTGILSHAFTVQYTTCYLQNISVICLFTSLWLMLLQMHCIWVAQIKLDMILEIFPPFFNSLIYCFFFANLSTENKSEYSRLHS